MASIKPLDGGKHTGRSKRNLTPFQWRAAMMLTPELGPKNSLPSDDVIDVARSTTEVIGIIEYPGDAFGKPTHVITDGRAKLKMTGTGKAGDSLKVVGQEGKGGKASADEDAFAVAVDDWADGDVVAVTLRRHVAAARVQPTETGTPADTATPRTLTVGTPTELISLGQYQSAAYTVAATADARVIVVSFKTPGATYFKAGQVRAYIDGGARESGEAAAVSDNDVTLGIYLSAGQSATFVLGGITEDVSYTVQADTVPYVTVPGAGSINVAQGTGRRALMVDTQSMGTLTLSSYAGTGYVTVEGHTSTFAFGPGRADSGTVDTSGAHPVILITPDTPATAYAFRAAFSAPT